MGTVLYGITTCDTVRKARRWLEANGVDYRYHDLRKDGLKAEDLERWVSAVGWQTLLNRAGTTFRKLPEGEKQVADAAQAIALMTVHPTVIKRPVLVHGGRVTVGYSVPVYEALFTKA